MRKREIKQKYCKSMIKRSTAVIKMIKAKATTGEMALEGQAVKHKYIWKRLLQTGGRTRKRMESVSMISDEEQ